MSDAPETDPERAPVDPDGPWSAEDWSRYLGRELGRTVEVRYTRARRQVVQSSWRGETIQLKLSACFADAPGSVRADFARWMRVGKRARAACARLDAWIETAVAAMPPARRTRLRPEGAVHDLRALADGVLAGELANDPALRTPPGITWGARTGARAVHSLRLGSYTAPEHLVRIHPVLDQEAVPAWFVRFIVFHELLHVALPPRRGAGARMLRHPPEFLRRERAHPDHDRAQVWQSEHLGALLESARQGRPMSARAARRSPRPGRTVREVLGQLRLW